MRLKDLFRPSRARRPGTQTRGFALISTFLLLVVLSSLLAAYVIITKIELATTKASHDSTTGFFAAEAGLNIRAEAIRTTFLGYNTPSGTSPSTTTPCVGGDDGGGDFQCQSMSFNNRTVTTYVSDEQAGTDPPLIPVTTGLYRGLNAQEYKYTTDAEARGRDGKVEAKLQLRFMSRVVPMFQFMAFYNKDLEILPGPQMNLSGPVHVNGDLYMNSDNRLDINAQVNASGSMYRGRKNDASCRSNSVRVMDPSTLTYLVASCPSRHVLTASDVAPFHGMVNFGVQSVSVPPPDSLDPAPGKLYWDKADLRIALRVDASSNPVTTNVLDGIEVRRQDNTVDSAATNLLYSDPRCVGSLKRDPNGGDNTRRAIGTSFSFYNNRERPGGVAKRMRLLDVDVRALLDCLHQTNFLGAGKLISDQTEGGLVLHFSVDGPNASAAANNYGVRIRNGSRIASTIGGAPAVRGITFVTDQGAYIQGNFNSVNKIPAAILSDSFNVLSENFWTTGGGGDFRDSTTQTAVSTRTPSNTTQNIAVLAGTDSTGGQEGVAGQGGAYNGGLENYPRFHENWTGFTYTYRGSFVSLNRPRHVNGAWIYGAPQYTAPNRNWDYDTSFNNASNLPPLTPRFVYLKQELFVRDFDQ